MRTETVATLAFLLSSGCFNAAGTEMPRGEVVFTNNCTRCHGPSGQGNPDIAAPSIAGRPGWYVETQLSNFRGGIRGAHSDDTEGLRMRPMARAIRDTDVTEVATHVANLKPHPVDYSAVEGDPERGETLYATCLACHGPEGKGMKALHAPPIGQVYPWYFKTQIHKFQNGVRGAHPKDTWGATMVPMSMTLTSEQDVNDVISYIATLPK